MLHFLLNFYFLYFPFFALNLNMNKVFLKHFALFLKSLLEETVRFEPTTLWLRRPNFSEQLFIRAQ